jgi:hypothetical protein
VAPWRERSDDAEQHPLDVLELDLPADVQDRATDVSRDHVQDAGGHSGEPANSKVGTHAGFLDGALRARDRQHSAPYPIAHAAVVPLEAPVDLDGLPGLSMAHVVDGDVVLTPEERNIGEGRALTDDGARDRLVLPLGNHPVLDAHEAATAWVWPARGVADGKDPLACCLEVRVYDDALLDPQSCLLGEARRRSHADARDDQIRVESGW